jgi:hypothetical protein
MAGDYIQIVAEWFRGHPWIVGILTGFSLLTIAASFVLVPWAIVRIPADYFAHQRPPQLPWARLHPGLRLVALASKNLLGVLLFLAGFIMALPLVPGPGIVTMLVGLALVDLPGKRRWERRIASRPAVFAAMNRLRSQYGNPPLEKPGRVNGNG